MIGVSADRLGSALDVVLKLFVGDFNVLCLNYGVEKQILLYLILVALMASSSSPIIFLISSVLIFGSVRPKFAA